MMCFHLPIALRFWQWVLLWTCYWSPLHFCSFQFPVIWTWEWCRLSWHVLLVDWCRMLKFWMAITIFQKSVIGNLPVKYEITSCQPYFAFGMVEINCGSLKLDMKFWVSVYYKEMYRLWWFIFDMLTVRNLIVMEIYVLISAICKLGYSSVDSHEGMHY